MAHPLLLPCFSFALIGFALLPDFAFGQEDYSRNPLTLVQRLFDSAPTDSLENYTVDGTDLRPMRESIEQSRIKIVHAELLTQMEEKAVVAVEFSGLDQKERQDVYVYLSAAASGWKVKTLRTPPMPPWARMARETKRLSDEDLRIALRTKFKSEDEVAAQLQSLRRAERLFGSDRELEAHFATNRTFFEELRTKAQPFLKGSVATAELLSKDEGAIRSLEGANPADIERIATALQQIGATWISSILIDAPEDAADKGFMDVRLWGFADNSVGFFWKPEGVAAPAISPNNYIVIRDLGGGWHFYRTT